MERAKFWGTGAMMKTVAPSAAANPEAVAQFGKFERLSASPGAAKSFSLLNAQIDVSLILPTVRVPTLVVHRRTDVQVPVERGRELASLIPDAKFIEYPDGDHGLIRGDVDALLGDVEEFITGIATVRRMTLSVFWPRFCLPTSSIQRGAPLRKAIMHGGDCLIVTINWRFSWWRGIAVL